MYLWLNDLTRTSRRLESVPITNSRERQLKTIREVEVSRVNGTNLCVIVSSLPTIDSIPFLS